jgi:hypothetical protein
VGRRAGRLRRVQREARVRVRRRSAGRGLARRLAVDAVPRPRRPVPQPPAESRRLGRTQRRRTRQAAFLRQRGAEGHADAVRHARRQRRLGELRADHVDGADSAVGPRESRPVRHDRRRRAARRPLRLAVALPARRRYGPGRCPARWGRCRGGRSPAT